MSGAHRVGRRHPTLFGVPDPWMLVVGKGAHGGIEGSKVSEFWRVVGGLQLVVARDGGSAGRVGGVGGGTDRGAVLGVGQAKEEAEPGGDLAVGRVTPEGGRRKVNSGGLGGETFISNFLTRTTSSPHRVEHVVRVRKLMSPRVPSYWGLNRWNQGKLRHLRWSPGDADPGLHSRRTSKPRGAASASTARQTAHRSTRRERQRGCCTGRGGPPSGGGGGGAPPTHGLRIVRPLHDLVLFFQRVHVLPT